MTNAHFHELGLGPSASYNEICDAYRRLTLKYHPDRPLTGNAERWMRISDAFKALAPNPVPDEAVRAPVPGRHVRRDLDVSFFDALHGRHVGFTHGTVRIDLQVPAGTTTGQRLRVPGRGEAGSPPGDLLVDVRVAPHKLFCRERWDLRAELRLTWSEAASGGPFQVPTPWGPFWLRFGRGEAVDGTEYILTGYGVRTGLERGDLIYTVKLVAPHWASQTLLDELRLLQQADAPRAELEASIPTPPTT